jgi:ribosomal-protein-alanine N-acetyltransferase
MEFPSAVPRLTDGVVTLRAHTSADVTGVLEQCIDPVSQRWTTVPVPYTVDDARRFVTSHVPAGWNDGTGSAFAIEAVDAEGLPRFAGTVELRPHGAGSAEIAFGLHPWARGKGIAKRACDTVLDWGSPSTARSGRGCLSAVRCTTDGQRRCSPASPGPRPPPGTPFR